MQFVLFLSQKPGYLNSFAPEDIFQNVSVIMCKQNRLKYVQTKIKSDRSNSKLSGQFDRTSKSYCEPCNVYEETTPLKYP